MPSAVDSCVLGVSAVDRFTETAAVDEHKRARLKFGGVGTHHRAGQIYATVQWITSQYPARAGCRERVFVIDG